LKYVLRWIQQKERRRRGDKREGGRKGGREGGRERRRGRGVGGKEERVIAFCVVCSLVCDG